MPVAFKNKSVLKDVAALVICIAGCIHALWVAPGSNLGWIVALVAAGIATPPGTFTQNKQG